MKYDLSAVELLKVFTDSDMYEPEGAEKAVKQFEKKNKITLPNCLKEFLEAAMGHPLLETADTWIQEEEVEYHFWHDTIQEILKNKAKDFKKGKEEGEFADFLHNPREKWGEFVSDYLEIGCDYAAAVVYFGIKREDLTKENPPVYYNHEDNPVTQWDKIYDSVSDYLLVTLYDALLGIYYDTALSELMEYGWDCEVYEYDKTEEVVFLQLMKEYGIETEKLYKLRSETADWVACCCNEEKGEVYLFMSEDSKIEVMVFSRE